MARVTDTGTLDLPSPYPGPRTFRPEERDKFYGRDREARDLTALIVSARLVLFYSQSGAGKSSLINTKIIPSLEEEKGFELLPIGRVKGYDGFEVRADNIFVYNLLASLHQLGDAPEALGGMNLAHFLDNLVCKDSRYAYDDRYEWPVDQELKPRVLIIDQFEEIFTTNNAFWRQRDEFFRQLGEALRLDEHLWIVLAMREDFIASLDPYLHHLADGLRHRFYMQQLRRDDALKAIKNPVAGLRPFDEATAADGIGAADLLVKNLLTIRNQGGDGEEREAEFVEPVQLQAVCYQMWEKLRADPGPTITCQDVEAYADVDTALTSFYEDTVADTVKATGVGEVDLRNWFEHELITEARTRNMVFRGEEVTGSLPTAAADFVKSRLLVREIVRPAGIWYELIHDRFVQPVLEANQAWRQNQPLLQLAERWAADRHNVTLLLPPDQLAYFQATDWQSLGPVVAEFMDASAGAVAEQARAAEESHRAARYRRLRLIVIGTSGLVLILAVATLATFLSARRAITESRAAQTAEARAVSEAGRADAARATADDARATAEAARDELDRQVDVNEALRLADKADEYLTNDDYSAAILLSTLARRSAETSSAQSVLFRAANAQLNARATVEAGVVAALHGAYQPPPAVAGASPFNGLMSGPLDGSLAALRDGEVVWWRLTEPGMADALVLGYDETRYDRAAFATGRRLLATAAGSALQIWRATGDEWRPVASVASGVDTGAITALAFSPDGRRLAVARCEGDDLAACRGRIELWDGNPVTGDFAFQNSVATSAPVADLAFLDRPGSRLVWAGNGGVVLEELAAGDSRPLRGLNLGASRPQQLAVAPDERWLVVVSCSAADATEVSTPATPAVSQRPSGVGDESAKPDDAGDCADYTARGWDLSEQEPVDLGPILLAPTAGDAPIDVAYLPIPDKLVLLKQDGQLEWWSADMGDWERAACSLAGRNLTADEWKDAYPRLSFNDYRASCAQFGVHVSIPQQLVTACREDFLAQAQTMWAQDPRLQAQSTATDFDEWAGGVLIDYLLETGADQRESCLAVLRGLQLPTDVAALFAGDGARRVVATEPARAPRWEFTAGAGDVITFAGVPLSLNRRIELRLVDEAGSELALSPSDASARLETVLPEAGRYALEVDWSGPPAPLAIAAALTSPQPLTLGNAVEQTNPSVRRYTFPGRLGQLISVAVTALAEGDPTLRLTNSGGTELAFVDDFAGSLNPRIESLMLPAADTYTLEVGWYSGGSFPYRLSTTVTEPQALALGETVPRIPGDRSLWQFEGRAGDEITLAVTADSTVADAALTLYDANAVKLTSVDDAGDGVRDPRLAALLPADGVYFVRVSWREAAAPYTLSTRLASPRPLTPGQTVNVAAEEQPNWRLSAAAGQVLTVAVTAQEAAGDPILTLYDDRLVPLTTSDDFDGLNPRFSVVLPASGDYLIKVGWPGVPGPYTITTALGAAAPLAYGRAVTADKTTAPVWQFEGRPGDLIVAETRATEAAEGVQLHLLDSSFSEVATASSSAGAGPRLESLLAAEGTYYLELTWPSAPGQYTFSLGQVTQPPVAAAGDTLAATADQRYWVLQGQPGEFVSLLVVPQQDGDSFLRLYDERGQPLASDGDTIGQNPQLGTVLVAETRFLEVGWNGAAQPYALTVSRLEPEALAVDESLDALPGSRLWQFSGERDTYALVEVTPPASGNRLIARLVDSRGAELALADSADGSTPQLGAILPADGPYFVVVSGAGTAESYSLSLRVSQVRPVAAAEPVEADADSRAWRFTGRAGAVVTISAETRAGGDLTLGLRDAQGVTLAYNDDRTGDTRDPQIVYTLPEDGEYLIEVGWYPGTEPGAYRLTLSDE